MGSCVFGVWGLGLLGGGGGGGLREMRSESWGGVFFIVMMRGSGVLFSRIIMG